MKRAILLVLSACGGSSAAPDSAVAHDAPADVAVDAIDKAAPCASTFGTGLPTGFGRMDATVLAVVPPGDQSCAAPNATHLVLEVMKSDGAFRMVVDVLSNQGSPDVLFDELDAPLAGLPWTEGWNAGVPLDYVTNLAVHSTSFVATPEAQLVTKITSELDLGAKVSVFATVGTGEPDSAHLVHRNLTDQDGAIVLHPDTAAPHYLLMRFDEQSF